MDIAAIRTIKIQNWRWSTRKATKYVDKYIRIIADKYPTGLPANEKEEYFVVPGCEHVQHNQPIVFYHPTEGWSLSTTDVFRKSTNI